MSFDENALSNCILNQHDLVSNSKYKVKRIGGTNSNKLLGQLFGQQMGLINKHHADTMQQTYKLANTQIAALEGLRSGMSKVSKFQMTVQTDYYKKNLDTQVNILNELREVNRNL